MSDHSTALVPIESWAYNSPELLARGIPVDIGKLAESLIYYDRVFLNVSNQPQFAKVLSWFIQQGRFNDMLALFRDGILNVYEYSFATAPIYDPEKDAYIVMNIQDEAQLIPNSFEKRFLYHAAVEAVVQRGRQRQALYQALRDRVVEAKANEFAAPVEEARRDFARAERNALIVQAFVDELYSFKGLPHPPDVSCTVQEWPGGERHTVTVNIDFNRLADLAGPKLNWNRGSPLAAGSNANRLLASALQLRCDLYLSQPMSILIGDKLYESARSVNRSTETIESLKKDVEFPDVSFLVNEGRLDLNDVLNLRNHAQRFRNWLQSEADRDRDAIIAYHYDVAKETGFQATGRRALNLFGFIGGGAIGGALGAVAAGPVGAAVGGAIGGAVSYLSDVGAKIGADWKPVVFGQWLNDRIAALDRGRSAVRLS